LRVPWRIVVAMSHFDYPLLTLRAIEAWRSSCAWY
jgi:hypothetical protein